jgi:hypothetical protein
MLCGISPGFPELSPTGRQVGHVLLTRSPLYSRGCPRFLVRLACVRHAASVDSEPGSNSRLKPDVCRRVVGRQTRASSCQLLAFSKSQKRETNRPKPGHHHALEEAWWIYLVRSLGFEPESSSHDWHVQPSCQRPNRLPPERRAFSPGRAKPCQSSKLLERNLSKLRAPCVTVNLLHTQDFHREASSFWLLAKTRIG